MSIGKKIKQARKEMGWRRQSQLADALKKEGYKVEQQAISKWETDSSFPSLPDFPKIAKVLNKPVEWFFEEKEENEKNYKKSNTKEQNISQLKLKENLEEKPEYSYDHVIRLQERIDVMEHAIGELTEIVKALAQNDIKRSRAEEENLKLEKLRLQETKQQTKILEELKKNEEENLRQSEESLRQAEESLRKTEENYRLTRENEELTKVLILLEAGEISKENAVSRLKNLK